MRPVVISSSSYLAASKYQQRSAPSQKYSLGRASQEPQLRQSIRQYDRNIYKTPEKNIRAVAGVAGAVEYRQHYEGLINKQEEDQSAAANDEQLEIKKRRYLHYTADHVSQTNSSKNAPKEQLDMSYDLSSARRGGASKENEQRQRAQLGSSNNSYSGFISRSMNSSFVQQRQTHSPSKLLNDSMISDSSPSNKRLNYSSILSTTDWSTIAYAVPYPSNNITDNNSNNKGYSLGGNSVSANKSADSMSSSLLLSSSTAAAAQDGIRVCSLSDSKDLKYSLGLSNPTGKDNIMSLSMNNQINSGNSNSLAREKKMNESDVFKSIHIHPKTALTLLETLDTTDIVTNKKNNFNSNNKDNNNSNISYSVAGSSSSNNNNNIIIENGNAKLTNSTVNNENDRVIACAPEQKLPVRVAMNNYCIPSARQQQQQEAQELSSANEQLVAQQEAALRNKQMHEQPQQLISMSALDRLALFKSEEKYIKDDRQRAIQERFRRVDEITKKYEHLYKQINTDTRTHRRIEETTSQTDKVGVIQQEGLDRQYYSRTAEQIHQKEPSAGGVSADALAGIAEKDDCKINGNINNNINISDKSKPQLILQEDKEGDSNSLLLLQHPLENNLFSTPRFPTAPGIAYFASAEQIKLFSASKNKPRETSSSSSLINQNDSDTSSQLQQETLQDE